jgi:hypothetical protein
LAVFVCLHASLHPLLLTFQEQRPLRVLDTERPGCKAFAGAASMGHEKRHILFKTLWPTPQSLPKLLAFALIRFSSLVQEIHNMAELFVRQGLKALFPSPGQEAFQRCMGRVLKKGSKSALYPLGLGILLLFPFAAVPAPLQSRVPQHFSDKCFGKRPTQHPKGLLEASTPGP